MNPHDARARETQEWLGKAREDLASARVLIDAGHLTNALFLCQQAAEKSIKGFLTWHERPFRRTHDLEELGAACSSVDGTLGSQMERADILSEFAWKLRYPGVEITPERDEAEAMLALARDIFQGIQERLPREAKAADGEA